MINGDKALIEVRESGCVAYGSPVAGSSEIYQNTGAPLAGIIFLKKGEKNHAERLCGSRAYLNLYSEMVKCPWDEAFNYQLLELAEQVMRTTPILLLECTPELAAVECIMEFLGERKEL